MYRPSEFAKKVGVTVHTLQRWDREGRLVAKRTHTNRRYYADDDLAQVLGTVAKSNKKSIVYCRVSSYSQKPDLKNQRQMLEQFCAARGLAIDEWVEEIGGGMNFKRKKFLSIIDDIVVQEIGIFERMVDQLRPACAPSRIRNSNKSLSSWTGTPHSLS